MRAALVQGASRGIGLGLVRSLLDSGHSVVATSRNPVGSSGLRELEARFAGRLLLQRLDVTDEKSMADTAVRVRDEVGPLQLLVNCAGVLHETDLKPEKRLEDLDPERLQRSFAVNAVGPALMVKHLLPSLRHAERAVVANLSARVGSIEDNRLGGWYGYRASKAAQNQLTRTLALELRRRAPNVICVALHPGTVETDLSAPFRRGVAPEKLFHVSRAARQLMGVIESLKPEDTGRFLAWDGSAIPW